MKQLKKVEEEDPNEMFFEIFNRQMKGAYIFNIPHSSIVIPDTSGQTSDTYKTDIEYMTEYATEDIFEVPGIKKHVFGYSPVYCDVTRSFVNEPMDRKGHGIYYTKDIFGNRYRKNGITDEVLTVFSDYHHGFDADIDLAIKDHGVAIIVDCHSFLDFPLPIESRRSKKRRADVCLGYDLYHLPFAQADAFLYRLQAQGLSVTSNNPYKGSFVPYQYYGKNKKLLSIKIGINKKLYMTFETDEENRILRQRVDKRKVKKLNKIIRTLFE